MKDEFDRLGSEFGRSFTDNPTPEETKSFAGNRDQVEYNKSADETPVAAAKAKKKVPQVSANILTSMIATVGAVAVVAGAVIMPSMSVDAEILWTRVTDQAVFLEIDVGETDNEILLTVSNDFTRREVQVEQGRSVLTVDGLKPERSYTVTIEGNYGIGGNTKLAETTVRTASAEAMPSTPTVTYRCDCGGSGKFYFTLNFNDEYGYWTDFWATLTDADGNVATCEFTDNAHDQQSFDLIDNGVRQTAYLVIGCTTTQYVAEGEPLELFSGEVEI